MMKHSRRTWIDDGLLVLPGLLLLVIAGVLIHSTIQWHLLDLSVYANASERLLLGQIPYKDFALEYPPAALIPFVLPRLLAFTLPTDVQSYGGVFGLINVLYTSAIALVLAKLARDHSTWQRRGALLSYAALVAIFAPLLPWRYDLFVALLTLGALLAVQRERPLLAGVLLGIGVAAKLYPLVMIAALGVYYLACNDLRAVLRLAVGSIGATIVILLPFEVAARGQALSFLTYHELRGVQLESIAGGFTLLAFKLHWTTAQTAFNYGAMHLASPVTTALLPWLLPLFVMVVTLVLWLWFRCFRRVYQRGGSIPLDQLSACMVSVLLVFMVTNKVFSPQYMIWVLPFVPLLRPSQRVIFGIMLGCTIALFPFLYNQLLAFEPLPIVLLNVRNVLAVGCIPWLLLEQPLLTHTTLSPANTLAHEAP